MNSRNRVSSGAANQLLAHEQAAADGIELRLVPSASALRLLALTGAGRLLLPMYLTVKAALSSETPPGLA